MVRNLSVKALALLGFAALLAGSPASAQTKADRSAAEPTILNSFSSLIGRLNHVGDYVKTVAADANTVSEEEIAVSKQYRCLAQAVYFEARSEPEVGMRAVAHVVLNRLRDDRYPNSVCGVVFQNQHLRHRCQFSFACDGLSDTPRESLSWHRSLQVALEVLAGASEDVTGASTHYHASYVEPFWAAQLKPTVRLGAHLFYQEPVSARLTLTSAE